MFSDQNWKKLKIVGSPIDPPGPPETLAETLQRQGASPLLVSIAVALLELAKEGTDEFRTRQHREKDQGDEKSDR